MCSSRYGFTSPKPSSCDTHSTFSRAIGMARIHQNSVTSRNVPKDLQDRCDMVKFFYTRVEDTRKLIASNPSSIAAETRTIMEDILDYYDRIDDTGDIREIQSVKNWLGGDDKVLLMMVNLMWDYSQAEKDLRSHLSGTG